MLSGKKLSQIINNNILYYQPNAKNTSIDEFYSRSDFDTIGMTLN